MAPKTIAIPTSTRRAKRVIDSPSGSSSEASTPAAAIASTATTSNGKRPAPPDASKVEEEDEEDAEGESDDGGQEDDAEGEDEEEEEGVESEEGERDINMDRSRLSSAQASEDILVDDEENEEDEEEEPISPSRTHTSAPASALKIRLKLGGSSTPASTGRPGRAAAKKGAKKVKRVAEDELAESDDELLLGDDESVMSSRRSLSPTKMTARQRAKGNKDLQETLLQLPNEVSGKKLILTEAERLQRREETARRRKRQTEQKLQDEQDETINRLLRAQTSKSRSKLDQPSPALDGEGSGQVSPTRRTAHTTNMIRWTSTLSKEGEVLLRVAAPKEKEEWISLTNPEKTEIKEKNTICGVEGCERKRIYRSMKKFEIGGCSLDHLKNVEAAL
ncbi:uncharacterized protein IL334_001767 [Kwoniella shivajii]|uniref:INO80 complex subunit B-like conserved region domain-containing protein n=1 Tax=Kwoniella shivajii TaxID=564305 RepID=A0ABZ1CT36_9TREE|nr:hypothetical protein IL334_001767 [Kwoniella shivajii]